MFTFHKTGNLIDIPFHPEFSEEHWDGKIRLLKVIQTFLRGAVHLFTFQMLNFRLKNRKSLLSFTLRSKHRCCCLPSAVILCENFLWYIKLWFDSGLFFGGGGGGWNEYRSTITQVFPSQCTTAPVVYFTIIILQREIFTAASCLGVFLGVTPSPSPPDEESRWYASSMSQMQKLYTNELYKYICGW